MSDLEAQGTIKAFEFTFELSWNLLKDILEYQSGASLLGSRDAIRGAFKAGLISDGDGWMDMLASRNQSSHIYDQRIVDSIIHAVRPGYIALFSALETRVLSVLGGDDT